VGWPMLLVFADGSSEVSCALAYAAGRWRWVIRQLPHSQQTRKAPKYKISIPRVELVDA
jgi:hypothetical protein